MSVYNFLVDLMTTPQESWFGHSNRSQHVAVSQALELCRHTPRNDRDAMDQLELSLRYARYPCHFTIQCSCVIAKAPFSLSSSAIFPARAELVECAGPTWELASPRHHPLGVSAVLSGYLQTHPSCL